MATILTADKVIDVLEAVTASGSGIGTRALARELDLNVATVHNIAKTLEARGYLRQDQTHRRFHPGLRLMLLGRHEHYLEQLATIGRPHVRRLAAELDESIMLGALDRGRVINLDYVPSSQALRVAEPEDLGSIAYGTATGKIMLAAMPLETLDAFLKETPLKSYTSKSIATRERLMAELELIRQQQFSETRDELCEGVSALAVAIKDPWGASIAALGAGAPTVRMDRPGQREQTLNALKSAAVQIMRVWADTTANSVK